MNKAAFFSTYSFSRRNLIILAAHYKRQHFALFKVQEPAAKLC